MRLIGLLGVALVSTACASDPAAAQRPRTSPPEAPPAAQQRPAQPQAPAGGQATGTTGANSDAAAIADFKARVDNYVAVRKQAFKDVPPLKESEDPGKIKAAQDVLGARIAALRPAAKAGDIFTVEIQRTLRRQLVPETKGADGRDAKAVMKDDAPAPGEVPLKVNARYPEGTPLPTVAPNMLRSLPILPEGLEYRFIGRDLVLLDMDAQIIVDFMRNAIR